jgi:hypothetical protein
MIGPAPGVASVSIRNTTCFEFDVAEYLPPGFSAMLLLAKS